MEQSVKAEIRREVRQVLKARPPLFWKQAGEAICARVRTLPELAAATLLAGFVSLPAEPDLTPLYSWWLKQGKRLCLPRFDPAVNSYRMALVHNLQGDLQAGKYGIPEPKPDLAEPVPAELHGGTVWLIPGLAFSPDGVRLGRGGGYYDRLLAGVTGPKLGIAADCQLLPRLPWEEHDALMDCLVTENRLLRCPQTLVSPSVNRKEQNYVESEWSDAVTGATGPGEN